MSALHMSQRTRIHHEISFGQRLANEAKRAREVAITLPDGKKRDALLESSLGGFGRTHQWLAGTP